MSVWGQCTKSRNLKCIILVWGRSQVMGFQCPGGKLKRVSKAQASLGNIKFYVGKKKIKRKRNYS